MTIGGANNLCPHLSTCLDDQGVDNVLLWDIIPLNLAVESISEDILELTDGITHRSQN